MDAIALLTSLATDLDLMLNDLRSSSRFTSQQRASISVISHLGSDQNNFRQRRYDLESDDRNCSGLMEDDLQQLLPSSVKDSREDLCQSRASLVSSSDGGILAEGEDTSSESALSGDSASPPCDLGLVERLLRTHPVWFLPGIQRAGAVHLLQGKEEGNFIVRGSSQTNTMAVSVRLPPATGPYIEHYLVQSNDGLLSLESSRFKFDSIPALIAHYAQCCDELPVQLILPQALRDAKNRQQLSSLALLGQEFWRYPMSTPKPKVSPTNSSSSQIKSPNTETSGIGTILLSSPNQKTLGSSVLSSQQFLMSDSTATGNLVETPSDTASSLSSFTTSMGQQLLSPESIDSAMLVMSPTTNQVKTTSTFKINGDNGNKKSFSNEVEKQIQLLNANLLETAKVMNDSNNNSSEGSAFPGGRMQRPTPPNTLSLAHLRTPPQPPPRWSKPPTPASPTLLETPKNNFTVTTTVTFSVDGQPSPTQIVQVPSPTESQVFQTISKRLSPEGECHVQNGTLSSQGSKRWQQQTSKDTTSKMLSPILAETPTGRTKKSRRKESKHYQESDILESPSIYCRSALGDKISDYEDLWSQDNVINSPLGRGGNMSSFRPNGDSGKRPDILSLHPIITSLNDNKLSPPSSIGSNSSPPLTKSTDQLITQFNAATKPNNQPDNNNKPNLVKRLFGGGRTPVDEALSPSEVTRNLKNLQTFSSTVNIETSSMSTSTTSHRSSWHQAQSSNGNNAATLSAIMQPRNRLGLILANNCELPIEPCTPVAATPTSHNPLSVISHSKQNSPFYAEPADTLNAAGLTATVMKRTTLHRNIPSSHRHSEPPKSPPTAPKCPILSPKDAEKSHFTGSLDELKKIHRKARGRGDQWQLDSSWEFMGIENQNNENDYDSDVQWRNNRNNNNINNNGNLMKKPEQPKIQQRFDNGRSAKVVTVHQIIARRHPELNIHDLMRSIDPTEDRDTSSETAFGTFGRHSRISAYDNVDKQNHSGGYASSFLNSAQSDDGTVFSEPWDSSQWDSFLPNDDAASDTIHLSKCRSTLGQSEDDTIVEEHSSTTLTRHEHVNNGNGGNGKGYATSQHKVATIVRNRSCRDREVL